MNTYHFLVAMRPGVTPVPIPNTMVKTRAAENTILVTVWKDRWLPNSLKTTGKPERANLIIYIT